MSFVSGIWGRVGVISINVDQRGNGNLCRERDYALIDIANFGVT